MIATTAWHRVFSNLGLNVEIADHGNLTFTDVQGMCCTCIPFDDHPTYLHLVVFLEEFAEESERLLLASAVAHTESLW